MKKKSKNKAKRKGRVTTDRNDPGVRGGPPDESPVPQNEAYLVLSEEERGKGYIQPYRESYKHKTCGTVTRMSSEIAGTYARDPWFYGSTYCVNCSMHRPLAEFTWEPDGEEMAPQNWSEERLQQVMARQKETRK